MIVRFVAVGTLVLMAATACGGEKESEQAGNACGAPLAALSARPTLLPMRFPTPTGVTYTSEKRAGPAKIVSEHEEVDAEVNFAGGGSTGQVKLVQGCKDRTTITITARPA